VVTRMVPSARDGTTRSSSLSTSRRRPNVAVLLEAARRALKEVDCLIASRVPFSGEVTGRDMAWSSAHAGRSGLANPSGWTGPTTCRRRLFPCAYTVRQRGGPRRERVGPSLSLCRIKQGVARQDCARPAVPFISEAGLLLLAAPHCTVGTRKFLLWRQKFLPAPYQLAQAAYIVLTFRPRRPAFNCRSPEYSNPAHATTARRFVVNTEATWPSDAQAHARIDQVRSGPSKSPDRPHAFAVLFCG